MTIFIQKLQPDIKVGNKKNTKNICCFLRMELEQVFAATNRQPKSTVWIEQESAVVTSSTSSLLLHQINSSNKNICKIVRNDHPGT